MKAVEFAGTMTPQGQISLPPDVAGEVPVGKRLHVVIMWEPSRAASAGAVFLLTSDFWLLTSDF
jgi:hypothetical protein